MIGQPEILRRLSAGAGGSQRLPRAVGPARALELMLEGNALTAQEALEAGYVHRVVPVAELGAAAAETAARLARRSPSAVARRPSARSTRARHAARRGARGRAQVLPGHGLDRRGEARHARVCRRGRARRAALHRSRAPGRLAGGNRGGPRER